MKYFFRNFKKRKIFGIELWLLFVLLDYKRIPVYLHSIIYAISKNIFSLKKDFEGMLSIPEGVTLHKLASSLPDNSEAIEIGCYKGLSASFILSGLNKTSKLFSIDPFDKDLNKQLKKINKYGDKNYKKIEYELMKIKPEKKAIEKALRKRGFTHFQLIEDYSFNIAKKWHKKIDFLWIDASHEYKDVKRDFTDWSKFLKRGGIIAFHDANKRSHSSYWKWGWPGPTKVVDEFIKGPSWTKIRKVDSITYATKNF